MSFGIKEKILSSYAKHLVEDTFSKKVNILKTNDYMNKYESINTNKSYLLYIHIPFCDNLCPFCTFHKYKHTFEASNNYFFYLRKELKAIHDMGTNINSIYIGGGTPLINEKEIIKTIKFAKDLFKVEDISCETDPNHINPETIKKLKGLVKRLSIGVQSFNDKTLKEIGRYEKFGSSETLQKKLKAIINILPITSIDLIFNLPNQTEDLIKKDIEIAKNLNPEQITTYPLMSSELNKNFTKRFEENKNEYKFYNIILNELKDYNKNNMWSFSKFNEEKKLNDEYVSDHTEYIGAGSGAFSYLEGTLYINHFNLSEYNKSIDKEDNALMAECNFNKEDIINYGLLCSLFSGTLNINEFNSIYNTDIKKFLGIKYYLLKLFNLIKVRNNNIYLKNFSNYMLLTMMASFYTGIDSIRSLFKQDPHLKN